MPHAGIVAMRAVALAALTALAGCGGSSAGPPVSPSPTPTPTVVAPPGPAPDTVSIAATLDAQPLGDPVNTETLFLVKHGQRLFASTGQWTVPQARLTGGQVLVKSSTTAPWTEVLRGAVVRLSALKSIAVPVRYTGGRPTKVLLTITRDLPDPDAPPTLRWLIDEETSFGNAFTLPRPAKATIRAYGAHDDGSSFAFFTAATDLGIVRGAWNEATRTIDWSGVPELTFAAIDDPSGETVTKSFASCGGALYAGVERSIYRRTDGTLASGQPRWSEVYTAVDAQGSGLRGLTCPPDADGATMLASVEGNGNILRFDNLTRSPPTGGRLTPVVEASVRDVIRNGLAVLGSSLPTSGRGSVGYVIAAYNDFLPLDAGAGRVAYGVEWAYEGSNACPATRVCAETADFDTAACFVIRTGGATPTHSLRCLSGSAFLPRPSGATPMTAGEGFVAIRTIAPSPWSPNEYYFGGYDANSIASIGTAWAARASLP